MKKQNNITKVVRKKQLVEKIVIIDGQPGCGKTMLSPIVSSFNRVELLSYAFEIEFICRLFICSFVLKVGVPGKNRISL